VPDTTNPQITLSLPSSAAAAAPPAPPGYEIVGELGRGGMGVVYQARHVDLGRTVALKMILAGGHAGGAELARFRTEAQAIARLQHPNIVQVFEIGEHDGRPFLALEYCAGGSLDRRLHNTPLPPRDAARLVEQLARAVQAAHACGVVHRDLKPANILLQESDVPKIADFGLARKLDEASQTSTGAVLGTPSYMAPEQAAGRNHDIGPATDVYALGAILYECLTGRPPFKAASGVDTIMQVLHADPVPPVQLQPGVPRDLETICLRCLEKPPARRYAGALADDLQRFLAGEPILARPVGRTERLVKWMKRRPAVASLLAVVALVTLAGLAGIGWAYGLALERQATLEVERNNAVAAEKQAARDRDAADAARKDALAAERKADKDRQAADAARKDADAQRLQVEQQQKETDQQLKVARSALMTSQLLRANATARTEPAKGLSLLYDLTACPLELRDFAWHYCARQCDRLVLALPARFASAVALSPDGRVLAVAYRSAAQHGPHVQLLHAQTGELLRRLDLAKEWGDPETLAFSPDGGLLAVGGVGVTLWGVADGRRLTRWERPRLTHGLAFSTDGSLLACAGRANEPEDWTGAGRADLTICNIAEGTVLAAWSPRRWLYAFDAVAFSPDGRDLAATGAGHVVVFRTATAEPWLTRPLVDDPPPKEDAPIPRAKVVAFTADGLRLLASVDYRVLAVWRLPTGERLARHNGTFLAAATRPGRSTLVAEANKVYTLDGDRLQLVARIGGASLFSPSSLVLSADGRFAAGFFPGVRVWAVAEGEAALDFTTDALPRSHRIPVGVAALATALDETGRWLAVGSVRWQEAGSWRDTLRFTGEVSVWEVATGKEVCRVAPQDGRVPASLALCGDGTLLAVGWVACDDRLESIAGAVMVYTVADGKPRPTLRQGRFVPLHLAAGPTGRSLLGLCTEGQPRRLPAAVFLGPTAGLAWDLDSGAERVVLHARSFASRGMRNPGLTFGNRFVVLADNDGQARLWDLATGTSQATPYAYTDFYALPFQNGTGFVIANQRGQEDTLAVWDCATARERLRFPINVNRIKSAAVAPDGRLLATADGRQVQIWDLISGQERVAFALDGGRRGVHLVFSGDGRTLVAVLTDDDRRHVAVKVWAPEPGLALARLQLRDGQLLGLGSSPDGRLVTVAHATTIQSDLDLNLQFWDTPRGQAGPRIPVPGHCDEYRPLRIAFDLAGRLLAVGGKQAPVTLVDMTTGEQRAVLDAELQDVAALAFADGGRTLVVVRTFGVVQRWDVATSRVQAPLEVPIGRRLTGTKVRRATATFVLPGDLLLGQWALDGSGTLLATATSDGNVELWDLTTGLRRDTWATGAQVVGLTVSADGKTVAVAQIDKNHCTEIHLWDVAAGQKRLLPAVIADVSWLAFSPDAKRLAVASSMDLQVCRVADGKTVSYWAGRFPAGCFRADGRVLFALGQEIWLWELPP
jgi:WD40 repeat protein